MEFYQALILVICANAAPLLTRYLIPFRFWNFPLDFHLTLPDGHPLLGSSKTIRGLGFSFLLTAFVAWLLDIPVSTGLVVAGLAMTGDLLTSFIKRRFAYPPGKSVVVLDQFCESLFPLFYLHKMQGLEMTQLVAGILLFTMIDLVFSRLLLVILGENPQNHNFPR